MSAVRPDRRQCSHVRPMAIRSRRATLRRVRLGLGRSQAAHAARPDGLAWRTGTTLWSALFAVLLGVAVAACEAAPAATPAISPGSPERPREVNLIAHDYVFSPPVLDLVPGETVLLHVVNGGLAVHEAVIGSATAQALWEHSEAGLADEPPGPTPVASVPEGTDGIRIVVNSGERKDVVYHVPVGASELIVGCHIPGHWARGMQIPVRLVVPASG